jgi:hypothetical protein
VFRPLHSDQASHFRVSLAPVSPLMLTLTLTLTLTPTPTLMLLGPAPGLTLPVTLALSPSASDGAIEVAATSVRCARVTHLPGLQRGGDGRAHGASGGPARHAQGLRRSQEREEGGLHDSGTPGTGPGPEARQKQGSREQPRTQGKTGIGTERTEREDGGRGGGERRDGRIAAAPCSQNGM